MGQVSLLELKEMLESKSHVELTREDWQLLPFVLDTNLDGHVDVRVRPHSAPVALQSMPRGHRSAATFEVCSLAWAGLFLANSIRHDCSSGTRS